MMREERKRERETEQRKERERERGGGSTSRPNWPRRPRATTMAATATAVPQARPTDNRP
jgi:hypothetical protein